MTEVITNYCYLVVHFWRSWLLQIRCENQIPTHLPQLKHTDGWVYIWNDVGYFRNISFESYYEIFYKKIS